MDPRLLILDEPAAGVAREEAYKLMQLIRDLGRRQNMTIIFIEHDMDIVFNYADEISVLRGGGDTRFLVFADLVFVWLLDVPLGYLAGLVWGLPPFWVFVCLKLDVICKTFLCLWRLLSARWIHDISRS